MFRGYPELARALPDPIAELSRELWIVTHVDLRHTARVQAFFEVVGEGLAAERALFEGRHRGPPLRVETRENIDRGLNNRSRIPRKIRRSDPGLRLAYGLASALYFGLGEASTAWGSDETNREAF